MTATGAEAVDTGEAAPTATATEDGTETLAGLVALGFQIPLYYISILQGTEEIVEMIDTAEEIVEMIDTAEGTAEAIGTAGEIAVVGTVATEATPGEGAEVAGSFPVSAA